MTNSIDDEILAGTHPTHEQLERFALGALESNQASKVETHIAGCETCCKLLDATQSDNMHSDKLIDLLRKSTSSPSPSNLRLIAGYQILDELGRGGMGVVYRALQPALRRQVALKMIAQGVHAGQSELMRFRREAEATAALHHPYIAQVYDVGELDGQPYIAMELIQGRALSEHLLSQPLRFEEAARLLVRLAQAIQHAHASGIVHRDLKPQNILLESFPDDIRESDELRPKIVDFGLAKRIEPSATVTSTGIIVGTPSYMSPEQATGNNALVGPSTDIYALGAILYEALAGRPPFKGVSPIETLTQVRTAEPVRPSVLRPGLPRDLETICLKCLQKSPKDRYLAATDLIEDLDRFLDGRPILARPVGLTRATWKWTKRHPAVAALIGVIILASASLTTLGLVYNASLRNALGVAKTEQARADENFQFAFQAVEQMLERVGFAQLADTPEMEGIREKLLAEAVEFYSKMLDDQPRADVDSRRQYYNAMTRLGKIQWTLGDKDSALRNLDQAIVAQQSLSAQYPERYDIQHEFAVSHINKGMVTQDAADFRHAIDVLQGISEAYPICKRELAQAINNLANVTASIAERERLHLRALELRQELLQASPDDSSLLYGLGETQHNLGFLYNTTGRTAESESAYREALRVFERLVNQHDSVTDYRNALAESMTHIASVVHTLGRTDEAITLIERATDIRKLSAARFPKLPAMREAVIRGLLTQAAFLIQTSRFARASEVSHEAVEMAIELAQKFDDASHQLVEAGSLTILATALSGELKMAEARETFERANSIYEALLKAEPTNPGYRTEAGVQFMNFSNALRQEDPKRAAEFNNRSTALLEQLVEDFPQRIDFQSYLFNAHGARATTYEVLGDYREAVVSWNRALQLAPPEQSRDIGILRALALSRSGDHALATEACKTLIKEQGISGLNLYNLACVFGVADKASKQADESNAAEKVAEDYCTLAIELLNRSETIAFLRVTESRQQLMVDADLETIRAHAAFAALLERLDAPQD
ncbi:MAG: serine/threonine-protein kinase [Pirellulaceae bacterium]|nr:serine/threonine-protein kinase [Pirellulaceae bacterium]